ncbi:MAG: iron-containing alcohol dehydrogenase [Alphaproteobacteria bacterium]|nr:iron-containing alcohol dehydrogenase [Alphaproteobacteria bacterium]
MDLRSRTFRAVGFPLRLHSGENALDQLEDEVERRKAKRAYVICGRTVATKTDLLGRIAANLGPLYAGAFQAMDKDSSWPAVRDAVEAARAAEADLLIALGGGSVIVGTRAVAILLAEKGDAFSLMTQYPEGKPAYSPRLMAPKPPIINVVTTPTTAMNRAGTGLKNEDLDHRMEFFDPKTRPCAIFWDAAALLTAPAALIRSTATTGHSSALRALGSAAMNPLVEADRRHAFRLLNTALPRVMEEPENAALRIDLCAAAFLQNRADDDDQGRRRARDQTGSNAYALATALHIRYDNVWQGESTSSVIPAVTRLTPPEDVAAAARIAGAIGVWKDGMTSEAAVDATASALEALYRRIGMPARLRDLDIPKAELPLLAQDTLKNFNANPGDRPGDYTDRMLRLLEAAW